MHDEACESTHWEREEHEPREIIEGPSIEVHENEHHEELAGHVEERTTYGKGIYGDLRFEGLMKNEHYDE